MKRIVITIVLILPFFVNVFSQKKSKALKTQLDSVSYALGVNIAEGFTKQNVTSINRKKVTKGFNDFEKNKPKVSEEESMKVLQNFMMNHQMKAQDTLSPKAVYKKTLLDSVSYALGVNVSESFKKQGVEGLSGKLLGKGLLGFYKGLPILNAEKSLSILQSFMSEIQAAQVEKEKLAAAPRIEVGEAFLSGNAKRPEVITLPSGLQYEIIKEGKGEVPTESSMVSTHYHGSLIDGTVFDSSVDRGEPVQFGVTQVIPGWTEALQLMPVGSKWMLYIPYDLAYGERGTGAGIKPYSTLIFEVELLEIVK